MKLLMYMYEIDKFEWIFHEKGTFFLKNLWTARLYYNNRFKIKLKENEILQPVILRSKS